MEQLFKPLILFILFSQCLNAKPEEKPTAQSILDQWFSIDSTFDINMQQQLITDKDDIQQRLITYTSDDQHQVNGTITMAKQHQGKRSLALLLHAMGSDQQLWWQDNKIHGHDIAKSLLEKGYIVITLDARRHGKRAIDELTAKDMINKAHSAEPRMYTDMIIGTIRDYRLLLNWLKTQPLLKTTGNTLAAGYSMGAQMALILGSYEPTINKIITMVPPYVKEPTSPVAPRLHVPNIKQAQVLFLAAKQDPYSTTSQNQQVFDLINSSNKSIKWFESGHLLPDDYYLSVLTFIKDL